MSNQKFETIFINGWAMSIFPMKIQSNLDDYKMNMYVHPDPKDLVYPLLMMEPELKYQDDWKEDTPLIQCFKKIHLMMKIHQLYHREMQRAFDLAHEETYSDELAIYFQRGDQ